MQISCYIIIFYIFKLIKRVSFNLLKTGSKTNVSQSELISFSQGQSNQIDETDLPVSPLLDRDETEVSIIAMCSLGAHDATVKHQSLTICRGCCTICGPSQQRYLLMSNWKLHSLSSQDWLGEALPVHKAIALSLIASPNIPFHSVPVSQ